MVIEREVVVDFGEVRTVQTYYRCDVCDIESNCLEWFINITRLGCVTITCPVCKFKHEGEHNAKK